MSVESCWRSSSTRRNRTWFFIGFLLLRCSVAVAQNRVSVRFEPKPDQTIHVTTTQEVSISLNVSPTASDPVGQMRTETVLEYTQVNGRFDDHDRMESQLTLESIEIKQSLNGTTKSPGSLQQLRGRSLTAIFDRGGKLVDIRVPEDLKDTSGVLKQMVAVAYGASNFLPATAMSVGDTETNPSSIPLRLPGSATPVPYQTRTITTLLAVENNGSDRLARFQQRIESAAENDLLKVNGAGTIEVNLDRGFVTAIGTEWSFAGEEGVTRNGTASPFGAVRGTIKVTVEAHE